MACEVQAGLLRTDWDAAIASRRRDTTQRTQVGPGVVESTGTSIQEHGNRPVLRWRRTLARQAADRVSSSPHWERPAIGKSHSDRNHGDPSHLPHHLRTRRRGTRRHGYGDGIRRGDIPRSCPERKHDAGPCVHNPKCATMPGHGQEWPSHRVGRQRWVGHTES